MNIHALKPSQNDHIVDLDWCLYPEEGAETLRCEVSFSYCPSEEGGVEDGEYDIQKVKVVDQETGCRTDISVLVVGDDHLREELESALVAHRQREVMYSERDRMLDNCLSYGH